MARLLTRRGFRIVGWHGVSFQDEHKRLPQYFVSVETLQQRLLFLQKHFHFTSLEEAVTRHASGSIASNQVVLTFDDGMYNFAARAVPVLKNFSAPATVYVVTSTMQRPTLAGMLLIQDMFGRTTITKTPTGLCGVMESQDLSGPKGRAECISLFQEQYLNVDEDSEKPFLTELAKGLEVHVNGQLAGDTWRMLATEEVRELSSSGISVQLHTHNHRDVVRYPDTVYDEAKTCREIIEAVTGSQAVDFCYPTGYWTKAAWDPLLKAGVRSGVTCNGGPNFRSTPALALRRQIDTECLSQIEFEFALSGLQWILRGLFRPASWFQPAEVK